MSLNGLELKDRLGLLRLSAPLILINELSLDMEWMN